MSDLCATRTRTIGAPWSAWHYRLSPASDDSDDIYSSARAAIRAGLAQRHPPTSDSWRARVAQHQGNVPSLNKDQHRRDLEKRAHKPPKRFRTKRRRP